MIIFEEIGIVIPNTAKWFVIEPTGKCLQSYGILAVVPDKEKGKLDSNFHFLANSYRTELIFNVPTDLVRITCLCNFITTVKEKYLA